MKKTIKARTKTKIKGLKVNIKELLFLVRAFEKSLANSLLQKLTGRGFTWRL